MTNYEDFVKELLKDPEVKREYEALEPKYTLIQALLEYKIWKRKGIRLRKRKEGCILTV